MSVFELLAWLYVVGVIIASVVVLLGMSWARYCSWRIERDRELFWAAIEQVFARRRKMGPYR